jgi:hypothetical protein
MTLGRKPPEAAPGNWAGALRMLNVATIRLLGSPDTLRYISTLAESWIWGALGPFVPKIRTYAGDGDQVPYKFRVGEGVQRTKGLPERFEVLDVLEGGLRYRVEHKQGVMIVTEWITEDDLEPFGVFRHTSGL